MNKILKYGGISLAIGLLLAGIGAMGGGLTGKATEVCNYESYPTQESYSVQTPYQTQVPYTEKECHVEMQNECHQEEYDVPKETKWGMTWYTFTGDGKQGA